MLGCIHGECVTLHTNAEQLTIFSQAAHIREWVLDRCKFEAGFEFVFYPARYDKLFFSISPAQGSSIIDAIPLEKRDCAILEEPEHLNWWERKWFVSAIACKAVCTLPK
jgi:hypothetical protein